MQRCAASEAEGKNTRSRSMKLSRLVTHAVMLAISVGLAGIHFSGIGSSSEAHLTPVAADASVFMDAQTGAVSSVGMDRRATFIKPVGIPAVPMLSHRVVHHTVGQEAMVIWPRWNRSASTAPGSCRR
jgi:hypothetical protein